MQRQHRHEVSVGIERSGDNFYIKIKIVGKLTHKDYEFMLPILEDAVTRVGKPQINMLVDARQFDGWELQAAWDDLKFGLKHNSDFKKLAFVGNKKWEEYAIKFSNLFMYGELEYFEQMDEAISWLNEMVAEQKELTIVEKEIMARRDEIRDDLIALFEKNMKITSWDVSEPDDKEAAVMLVEILSEKLNELKQEVLDGKYDSR